MKLPNKFHKYMRGYFLFAKKGIIPYFAAHNNYMRFAKSQIPSSYCVRVSFRILGICLATIGVCAFGAVTSVAAFFIF